MLIYAFLLILLLRPSWGLWGLFSILAAVGFVLSGMSQGLTPDMVMIVAIIEGAIFCGLGALIVFVRLKFVKGKSSNEKEADAEFARIPRRSRRAHNQPPPAQ